MTFKEVIFKNFKYNIRKYIAHFLSHSFCVMVLFIMTTFLNNKDLNDKVFVSNNSAKSMLETCFILLVGFSLFFVTYSYSSFIRTRLREFGVYLSFGMTKKDIKKIVTLENFITMVGALVLGITLGTVFSRICLIAVVKFSGFTEFGEIGFSLSIYSFTFILELFTGIFIVTTISNMLFIENIQIAKLLKQNEENQKMLLCHPVYGFIGLLLMVLPVLIVYGYYKCTHNTNIGVMLGSLALYIISLYLITSQLGNSILSLIRKRKSIYYSRLINITAIKSRFNQYRRIFFATSILIAVIIFGGGLLFSDYTTNEKQALRRDPFNMSYTEVLDINRLPKDNLDGLLSGGDTIVKQKKEMEFILLTKSKSGKELCEINDINEHNVVVISQSQLNQCMGKHLNIKKGYATVIDLYANFNGKNTVQLKSGVDDYKLSVMKIIPGDEDPFRTWETGTFSYSEFITVLNDEDYHNIKKNIKPMYIGRLNIVDFKDWKKTEKVINKLKRNVNVVNAYESLDTNNESLLGDWFKVNSTLDYYNILKSGGRFKLFIFGFIVVLFLIASSGMLFFKLYSELEEVVDKYRILYKIGITNIEIRKQVYLDVKLVYFIPLVLGSIFGYIALWLIMIMIGFGDLIVYTLGVLPIYIIIQVIYYYVSSRDYADNIIRKLNS